MPIVASPLPTVESKQRYAPASLAREILNMVLTPEGVLESVRGPTALIPDYGSGYPYSAQMHGVFHATLENGMRDVTLVRSGSVLYVQTGWTRGVASIATGLSSDGAAMFPDQFVEVGGKIVWNNGVDAALVYDGYTVLPLGYDRVPAPPSATGPSDTGHPVFRNEGGYSHPGRIGTQGDFYTQESGAHLQGMWTYHVQFEDAFGNRSPLSPASGPVVHRRELTLAYYWADYTDYPNTAGVNDQPLGLLAVGLDDLGKQHLVQDISAGPEGTVARVLYRTPDQENDSSEPKFLVRIPDNVTSVFPDNIADGMLGATADDLVTVPRFQAMCAHQGRLVILADGVLRWSQPGFIGTFERRWFVPIGSDGARATAVWSFGGALYAATTSTIYRVEELPDGLGLSARAVAEGLGVVGPEAVAGTPFGAVGMGRDGFWRMAEPDVVEPISRELYPLFSRLQPALLGRVVMKWSPLDRELLVAVPYAGIAGNGRLLTWDGTGWKERQYGISVASMAVQRDERAGVLVAGKRVGAENNVWVLHGETQAYTPPTKTYRFRSAWLRGDPNGMMRCNVQGIWIGFVEASKGAISVTVWENGSRDTARGTTTVEGINPATADRMDTLVLGTGKVRDPKLTWKRIPVAVFGCESFAFDLECAEPTYMSIAAFAFDFVVVDPNGKRVNQE